MKITIVIHIILATISFVGYYLINNYLTQQQVVQAHLGDCKGHLIKLATAEQRYKQDGILGWLNGNTAADKQDVETNMQYINNTCLDVIDQLNKDPVLLQQVGSI